MPSDPPGEQKPRRTERVYYATEVSVRRAGTRSFRVGAFDLSPRGCKIEFVERPAVGERIWVKFDGLEALQCSVRWTAGHIGGVEFDRPLHQAVFERLVNSPT